MAGDPSAREVLRLNAEATRLGNEFGSFKETDGILVYERGNIRIQNPVRRYAGEVVVLGPRKPRLWIELMDARILNVLDDGLLVVFADMAMFIRNYPGYKSLTTRAAIAGWFRLTSEEYRYDAVNGRTVTAVVVDYGEIVSDDEAAKAVSSLMAEWKMQMDSYTSKANQIKESEKAKRDEAIRKFREDQEARRIREALK